jgi:hypothetical protein
MVLNALINQATASGAVAAIFSILFPAQTYIRLPP